MRSHTARTCSSVACDCITTSIQALSPDSPYSVSLNFLARDTESDKDSKFKLTHHRIHQFTNDLHERLTRSSASNKAPNDVSLNQPVYCIARQRRKPALVLVLRPINSLGIVLRGSELQLRHKRPEINGLQPLKQCYLQLSPARHTK